MENISKFSLLKLNPFLKGNKHKFEELTPFEEYPFSSIKQEYPILQNSSACEQSSKRWIACHLLTIMKTSLYNFDPLKPHFYIVKLGFTGVYINFLISAQNINCGYSLEPPCRGGSNEYPQSMFWAEIWKISEFFIWKFSVFGGEIFYIFEYACFRIMRIPYFILAIMTP